MSRMWLASEIANSPPISQHVVGVLALACVAASGDGGVGAVGVAELRRCHART